MPTVLLLAVRLSILAVVVAAVWHTLLAPAFHWHPLYAISGWYLTATGLSLAALTLLRGDIIHPPAGVLFMAAAAALFACSKAVPTIRSFSFTRSTHTSTQRPVGP